MTSTGTPSPPDDSSSSEQPRWPTVVAAAGAGAAGVLAMHSPAWAAGLGTAAALFAAIREVMRH